MTVALRPARFPDDLAILEELLAGYVDFLLSRVDSEDRMALQSKYDPAAIADLARRCAVTNAPPTGLILLAVRGADVVGCGMLRTFAPGIAELQRIYVVDAARGLGLGRRLTLDLMQAARDLNLHTARLDTGRRFDEAVALYETLGFVERDAYHDETPEMAHMLRYFEVAL